MKQIKNLLCLPWRISTVRKGLTMLLTGHFHWAGPLLRPLAPAHQMSGNLTQHMHTHTRRDSLSQSNDVPDFPKQPLVKHHQVRQESPSCVTASQMVPSGQKPSVLWSVWPGSHWPFGPLEGEASSLCATQGCARGWRPWGSRGHMLCPISLLSVVKTHSWKELLHLLHPGSPILGTRGPRRVWSRTEGTRRKQRAGEPPWLREYNQAETLSRAQGSPELGPSGRTT